MARPAPAESRRLARLYDRTARLYDLLDWPFERFRYGMLRRRLFEGLTAGRLLDVGVGTGRNMAYYPPGVTAVGVDVSRAMLTKAKARAGQPGRLGQTVRLAQMDATALGLRDASFDAVVATFLFCVLPDPLHPPALAELLRVCRPDGRIILLEYQYSQRPWRRLPMRLLAPYVEWMYGARFDRRLAEHLGRADVEVVSDTFLYSDVIRLFVLRPLASFGGPDRELTGPAGRLII